LYALRRRVCPLVILSRQVFHSKSGFCRLCGKILKIDDVALGLAEDEAHRLLEDLFSDVVHIIAIEHANALKSLDTECLPQVLAQLAGLNIKAGPLFDKYPPNHRTVSKGCRPGAA